MKPSRSFLTRWQLAVREAEGYARGEVTSRNDDDPRLTPTEVAVAFVLSTYATSDGTRIYPGATAIARGAGVSLPTAKAARARLVAAGWLSVVRRGGSLEDGRREPSEYRLAIPTGSPALPVADDDRYSGEHRPVAQDDPTGSPRLPKHSIEHGNEHEGVGRCRFCGGPTTYLDHLRMVDCLTCHPSTSDDADHNADAEERTEQNLVGIGEAKAVLSRKAS